MDDEIYFEYEDMLKEELNDIMQKKRNGMSFSVEDICNGEKILKSIEHIERISMMDSVSPEDDLMYGTNQSYRANQYGNNYSRNQYGRNYGNMNARMNYSSRRSGHSPEDFRNEIMQKLNMTNDPQEKMFLNNWLNELNNH